MEEKIKALENRAQELEKDITKLQLTVIANEKSIKNNSISISFLAVTAILLSMRLMWG
jgi:uncharacterized coiled-coil protein SlyX